MPITQEQLEMIKEANLAKSVTWEAAHFLAGDVALTHGFTARRTDNAWICTKTGLQYATLSRWARAKLNRQTFSPRRDAFLMVGREFVPMVQVPPVVERRNYSPWVAELPRYDPEADSIVNAIQHQAPAEPQPSHLDGIEGRLDDIDASATEQNKRLKNLEERTESCEEDHHKRILALQSRIDYLEERLLATAAVAAHILQFKERIEALESKNI